MKKGHSNRFNVHTHTHRFVSRQNTHSHCPKQIFGMQNNEEIITMLLCFFSPSIVLYSLHIEWSFIFLFLSSMCDGQFVTYLFGFFPLRKILISFDEFSRFLSLMILFFASQKDNELSLFTISVCSAQFS